MNVRTEIKAQIIRAGLTMQEVVDLLSDEYGWSDSVSNLSAKLQRESIRYKEVLELATVLGYDIVFDRCVDVMTQLLQKYGHQVLDKLEQDAPQTVECSKDDKQARPLTDKAA